MNTPKRFVRNAHDKKKRTSFSLVQAFLCAIRGLLYVLSTQRNVKIYSVFIALALILGFLLQISINAWLAVVLCIAVVLAAESVNTAIESLVDLVSPEYADLAKQAKDCAAAAVLVCAIGSLIVGVIVYGSSLAHVIGMG